MPNNHVAIKEQINTITTYAKVAIDIPVNDGCFYYAIPEELRIKIKTGSIVFVPFGRQNLTGFVIETGSKEELNIDKNFDIKQIHKTISDKEIISKNFLDLAKWVSNYYLTNIGTVLAASIFISKNKKDIQLETTSSSDSISHFPLTLNLDQQKAFDTIQKAVKEKQHKTYLLHGVTGSGKTEVYLRLIEESLKDNQSVLYLVPEIYLIPQTLSRLKDRFGESRIVIWHSALTQKQRSENWQKLMSNQSTIVLGARSALLSPVKNIGLIVIDEAHESSYKQASPAPRYDAIKVGITRAKIENCPIVLGTATPNISDYFNCLEEHSILQLPNRIENVPMPQVNIVDLKENPHTKGVISNLLKANIASALEKKEQIILLLNRRGYASHIFCMACGYIQNCKNCAVPMVYHKESTLLICHHCGYAKSHDNLTNTECPECKSQHFRHFGIGTQQLEEEVKRFFPQAKTVRVDKDQLRKKDQYLKLWHEFSSGQADILIGTQLVAKGIDLPNVTVVGVVIADTMLNFPDYVSYERAFQLLTQVTGRTGRGIKPGKVFIQTYQADNAIFNFIKEHNYIDFYKNEIEQRKQFSYPPFTSLSRIILQSKDEKNCLDYANYVLQELNNLFTTYHPLTKSERGSLTQETSGLPLTTCLGPSPCFFTKLHNKFRYHILCKTNNDKETNSILRSLLQKLEKSAKVDLIIDIDSVNLL